MLFKKEILRRIGAGEVTLAFRRWRRPTVRQGGWLRTGAGVLKIRSVSEIAISDITDRDAGRAGYGSAGDVRKELSTRGYGEVYRIEFEVEGPDPRIELRNDDRLTQDELADLASKLALLDARSRSGKWARIALELIAGREGRTAGELANEMDLDKSTMKLRIRKLKELGLTESLQSGYRISGRGRKLVSFLRQRTGD